MIEVKKFSGVLDTDGAISEVSPASHIDARNVVFRGDGDNKRVQNVPGTIPVDNSFLPSGTNHHIGSLYDVVRQRVYWFNYNDSGRNGLYLYDTKNGFIAPVFRCFTNSINDILNFDLNRPIKSINILYGDDDIIYFLDSLKRPSKINVTQYLLTNPTGVTRLDLNVLKNPPSTPPTVVYANDVTVSVNSNRKNLFQFRYRYVYSELDKSVWSSVSRLPLPIGTLLDVFDANPNNNGRIDIGLNTGSADVKKVEIAMRKSLGSVYSKWYLIETLDKAKLSIGNNITYTYPFFNNAVYNLIDEKESDLLFDLVPEKANAQELLNGNILIYGGIEEGLSRDVTPDITITSTGFVNSNIFSSVAAWAYNSTFGIGIAYFNDSGKTNGVFIDQLKRLQTIPYSESAGATLVPQVNLSIAHRPPIWATSYQWVRTSNATKQWFLEFVTTTTFKDDRFAYLSMQSLQKYALDSPSAQTLITYEFNSGDRITFLKKINNTGAGTVYTNRDYEVLGIVSDPILPTGQVFGQFIKIALPSDTSGTFDFGMVSGVAFNNYLIEVYTPTKGVADKEANPYFEFGQRYSIGNAGLSTRYHLGQTQNQTPDLSQPATFSFIEGDVYARIRPMGIGNIMDYTITAGTYTNDWAHIGVSFNQESYIDAAYTPQGQTAAYIPRLTTTSTNYILHVAGAAKKFRVQATLEFSVNEENTTVYLFLSLGFFTVAMMETNTTPRVYLFSPKAFSIGSHVIKVDVTLNVPASTDVFLTQCVPTGKNIIWSPSSLVISEDRQTLDYIEDKNFSDLYSSAVNSNGRALVIDENQKSTYNSVLIRWGLAYQQGTDINQINRFYPENFDVVDRSKGDIEGLKVRERILRIFQRRGIGRHGVYTRFVKQADGSTGIITTSDIITSNNVNYYSGEYGVGNQYTSIVSSTTNDYFVDPVRGYQCRVSDNGIDPISEQWKGQFFIRGLLTPYNRDWLKADGSIARIHGYFDYMENQYVAILEGGTNSGLTINSDAIAFCERNQGNPSYTSFFDYYVDGIICAEEVTFSWKNGMFYKHVGTVTNNFHGVQYDAYITVPFNDDQYQKKVFQSISQIANKVWPCSLIYSDTNSYGIQRQESNLVASDFKYTNERFQAAFLRDVNSIGGIANGDKIKGAWIVIKFHIANASTFVYLSLVEVKYNPQSLTPR